MAFNGTGSNVTALNASNISSGTVATGRLATSGTANNTTFLRGDQIWSALPAGGGLTNNVRQAVTSSATTTININSGNVVDLTMASNITTLAFSNVPASGTPLQLVLVFRNDAVGTNYQVTWPASIYWNVGSATLATASLIGPTLASGADTITVISLLTTDGGTKWRGWVEASILGQSAGNNQLYSWGQGYYGNLGQGTSGTSAYRSSPVQIGSFQTWATASISGYTPFNGGGVLTTGQLYMWGNNNQGSLGLNNVTIRTTPTRVGDLTNWATVSASDNFTAAIKTDGTLWTWGRGADGRLGLGDVANRSSPVQVGALTNWAQVNAQYTATNAIKTDGTLWAWGSNNNGQLGLNNTTNYSSPKQVGALTNWAKLNAASGAPLNCAAIKTDGTLWTWGRGTNGTLGHGNTSNYSSPKQVGALTTWSSVSMGGNTTANGTSAIKNDGTLWTWGAGTSGMLGLGNTTSYSSPKQLGAATDWSKSTTGQACMFAVKTGGTLWAWGTNNYGQLGQNNQTNYSSPKQVGAETYWADVKGGSAVIAFRASTIVNPA
jgi:alpha-tubulin suppressor-like RCC1 family protein